MAIAKSTDEKFNLLIKVNHAFTNKNRPSVLSANHIRTASHKVHDAPMVYGGWQHIKSDKVDANFPRIPLKYKDGLIWMELRKPTEYELQTKMILNLTPERAEWTLKGEPKGVKREDDE